MIYENPDLVAAVQQVIEFVGTFAFAISGIRHAAARHFDWFGGFVCGIVVAIGGGTLSVPNIFPKHISFIKYYLHICFI